MRAEERHQYILNAIKKNGSVSILEAAAALDVSDETIRRDINVLSEKNLLKKVRGGASAIKLPYRKEKEYLRKNSDNQTERLAICNEAANMFHSNMVVALTRGISITTMTSLLSGLNDVTFVVNSLSLAEELADKIRLGEISGNVIMTGGELCLKTVSLIGNAATDVLDTYTFDLSICSCTALSAEGASVYLPTDSAYFSRVAKRSAVSVLLVESFKLGKKSTCTYARLSDFDRIITDNKNPVPDDILKALENSKTELVVVECE